MKHFKLFLLFLVIGVISCEDTSNEDEKALANRISGNWQIESCFNNETLNLQGKWVAIQAKGSTVDFGIIEGETIYTTNCSVTADASRGSISLRSFNPSYPLEAYLMGTYEVNEIGSNKISLARNGSNDNLVLIRFELK